MIRQDSPAMPFEIQNWGCLFFSILWHGAQKRGSDFTTQEILDFYQAGKTAGFIGYLDAKNVFHAGVRQDDHGNVIDGMYINDIVALANLVGLEVTQCLKANPGDPVPEGGYEILHFHRNADTPAGMKNYVHDHFVDGDGNENVANDSLGLSNTVKYGFLENKRILV